MDPPTTYFELRFGDCWKYQLRYKQKTEELCQNLNITSKKIVINPFITQEDTSQIEERDSFVSQDLDSGE